MFVLLANVRLALIVFRPSWYFSFSNSNIFPLPSSESSDEETADWERDRLVSTLIWNPEKVGMGTWSGLGAIIFKLEAVFGALPLMLSSGFDELGIDLAWSSLNSELDFPNWGLIWAISCPFGLWCFASSIHSLLSSNHQQHVIRQPVSLPFLLTFCCCFPLSFFTSYVLVFQPNIYRHCAFSWMLFLLLGLADQKMRRFVGKSVVITG